MKIKISIIFCVFYLLLLGMIFYLVHNEKKLTNINEFVHVSRYFSEAGYINDCVDGLENVKNTELKEFFGGVVSHHIPVAIPFLAEFYSTLKNAKDIDTFIILAPDHFGMASNKISISRAEFFTPFGKLMPDLEKIEELGKSGLVTEDEKPFDDHSIDSQMLFVGRFFPNSRVVPIMFRFDVASETAEKLGQLLAQISGPKTFIVASVDFSHYLNKKQAMPLDIQSASILNLRNPKLTDLIKSDSPQSLIALMVAVNDLGADSNASLGIFNSSEISNREDFTTGYVFQFFGLKQ